MNKKEKLKWIRARNIIRQYNNCNYGDFYCNHVYDPDYPWQWVDFRFFHSTKKIYFSVAAKTLAYDEYTRIEDEIMGESNPDSDNRADVAAWCSNVRKELDLRTQNTVWACPSIATKYYGRVCTGVFATLNIPFIDENEIRKFIAQFRALGEPTKPGLIWTGEEVNVSFEKLKQA